LLDPATEARLLAKYAADITRVARAKALLARPEVAKQA
jgi:hypothetical protein